MTTRLLIGVLSFLVATSAFTLAQAPDRVPALPGATREEGDLPDLTKFHPFQKAVYLSARRGSEWLWQANRPDGLFVRGQLPALNLTLEDDDFLQQAQGTMALAWAARFLQSDRYAVRARQAVLTLLAATHPEAADKHSRVAIAVEGQAQRVAAAAWIALSIHALPQPGEDILAQAEELCRFIKKQQADGQFKFDDKTDAPRDQHVAPAVACLALVRSHKHQPADWKPTVFNKLLARASAEGLIKQDLLAASLWIEAAADASLLAQDKAQAEMALTACDWLCSLQYGAETILPHWQGGFKGWDGTQPQVYEPGAKDGACVQGLAAGCRVARQVGDVQRFPRFREAIERNLQFLMTCQYGPANTRHFAEGYRSSLYGGFYAAPRDGQTRLDQQWAALGAMLSYAEHVNPIPR